jgi:hypothetical protein
LIIGREISPLAPFDVRQPVLAKLAKDAPHAITAGIMKPIGNDRQREQPNHEAVPNNRR